MLLKLVLIHGLFAFVILLCAAVIEFASFDHYWHDFRSFGMGEVVEELGRDFGGVESRFIRSFKYSPPLVVFIPFGAGGILGVVHYIFVRRRRSMITSLGGS